jgi:hypothetical protein
MGCQQAHQLISKTATQEPPTDGVAMAKENCNDARDRCEYCPGRTPLRPDPTRIQRARELRFEPPLDEGIREIVVRLVSEGVETFESCEGGAGHGFPVPTVKFEGNTSEGLRALSVALTYGLPVFRLRRTWGVVDGLIHGPWWEMTFRPQPKHSRS